VRGAYVPPTVGNPPTFAGGGIELFDIVVHMHGLGAFDEEREHTTKVPLGRTRVLVLGGTPAFMAPEVVLGVAGSDHRVDIYSLGCVAYWLLTGRMVFEGGNVMQVMVDHARTPAPRPSLRAEKTIPAPLEDLVMECLEKDPARRPPSAEVLAARLDAVPVTAPWSAERAERWWASHRPQTTDARPVADILLSHEGRQVRIGRRARLRG
jgi:serine/threonine protein kinase